MTQLIKVNQCISRYQLNFLGYANRYPWLKKRRHVEWKLRQQGGLADRAEPEQRFDDWLFAKQLLWASSTAEAYSPFPDQLLQTVWLRRLLKGINDVSFLMYQPVLLTKSGPVQLDSILLMNDRICCIHPLLGAAGDVFQPLEQRRWQQITNGAKRTLVNPLIALRRTKAVISAFLRNQGMTELQAQGVVYAPQAYIEKVPAESEIVFVDRRNEREWFQRADQHSLLLKREQVACAEALLHASETFAEPRTSES
ncbi:hypothetical protein [Sporolactobacillus inulinus]|jgi:hypothetical protein|uniref:NERD domain-containing protein n=2 Tax=Sporolactobacillus inulinus TaxID=2078 RepID=A0A4Y3T1N7_9BACL|nr:hypothetical protein [Sporolactobacillus inulinus]KLI02845.1 hypothetical protein SINU_05855 [Sporolactobacillus inulinus CASD]GAY77531.1 hypothetical protein NBRC111894_3085 [Sporolactobacillus inulinus]GEB75749.1 hypothetical protein SIN01_00940 [Sporolactobacillus inulinus]